MLSSTLQATLNHTSQGLYAETRYVETRGGPPPRALRERQRPYMQPLYATSAVAALENYGGSPRYRYGSQYGGDTPARIGAVSLSVCSVASDGGIGSSPSFQEHAISTTAADQNWPELLRYCQKFDEDMLSNWDGEIDTLLVFVSHLPAVMCSKFIAHIGRPLLCCTHRPCRRIIPNATAGG